MQMNTNTKKQVSEMLDKLDESVFINLSVNFNSDGIIMTRKQLKPKIAMIKNLILNFTIQVLAEKNFSYVELQEARDILMSQK